MAQVFQVTTREPQFQGQEALLNQSNRTYYRHEYESLAAAKAAAVGHTRVRVWAYEPGLDYGGEMLIARGEII